MKKGRHESLASLPHPELVLKKSRHVTGREVVGRKKGGECDMMREGGGKGGNRERRARLVITGRSSRKNASPVPVSMEDERGGKRKRGYECPKKTERKAGVRKDAR